MPDCFFKVAGAPGECRGGRLVRCHLIPKQRIVKEFAYGAWRMPDGSIVKVERADLSRVEELRAEGRRNVQRKQIVWDIRVYVLGCDGHHQNFDYGSRPFRLTRSQLPPSLEEFAGEYGLEWSLDRDYGAALVQGTTVGMSDEELGWAAGDG